jgi:thymidylate synthase ThyX
MVFESYGRMFDPMFAWFQARFPREQGDSDPVYRSTITAKTCDTLRLLLPAATRSNLGIYATGQSYEQLLMRLAAHPLAEMRSYGELMLTELRKVIPAFLKRVDVEDRGVAWSTYWRRTRERSDAVAGKALVGMESSPRPEVTLTDWDPDGEVKVVAAAMYPASDLPDDQLLDIARELSSEQRNEILAASIGDRSNRRHKPGRAWERTDYRFDVCCDYGAFRDLQRHRPLTVEWQRLRTELGYDTPPAIDQAGLRTQWEDVMEASSDMERRLRDEGLEEAAQYAVAMAYRIRFVMQMNAREAMHVIELRSTPQGHPVYRRVVQEMHQLINEKAGHHAIAAAMRYLDTSNVELERLEAERRTEAKRALSEGRG